MAQSPVPSVINNRYEVGETIGRGGMATVYVATDQRLGRKVAIKVLKPELARDESFQERFQREAEAVAGLNHHTITSVYDTGEIAPQQPTDVACPYIVMEYVPGRTLRELIRAGELSARESVDAMLGILDALAYSHRSGIIHRDIKPANVVITPDGRVKVMDFGIARAVEDTQAALTQTQAVLGTAQYLSPEQARGENVDVRSDLYSAACVFFEMLTGRAPFVGEASVDIAAQHVRDAPPAPSELAPRLHSVFDGFMAKGLAKARDDRFQSAQEMQEALEPLREHADVDATTIIAAPVLSEDGQDDDATRSTAPVFPISTAAAGVAGAGAAGAGAAGADVAAAGPAGGSATSASGAGASVAGQAGAGSATGATSTQSHGSLFAPPGGDDDAPVGARSQNDRDAEDRRRRTRLWLLPLLLLLLIGGGIAAATMLLRGPDQVTVPDVVGMSQEDAEAELEDLGLVTEITRESSNQVDEDTVISSDPGEGSEVDSGSTVTLTVSEGSDKVTVPDDLAGQSEVYAREMVGNAGLNVSGTRSVNHPSIARGLVVGTDPEGGSEVDRDSDLELLLSTGQVTVPDVVGMSRDNAVAAIEGGDVQLPVEVATEATSSSPAGTVLRQSTPGGTDVNQGTTITITVATAPRQAPAPAPSPGGGSSPSPSPSPTDEASDEPTQEESDEPTQEPTEEPADEPTQEPEPTQAPEPTSQPTRTSSGSQNGSNGNASNASNGNGSTANAATNSTAEAAASTVDALTNGGSSNGSGTGNGSSAESTADTAS
ncbi:MULTISPECIES: Stk1 family PASTA domain-containing Ser/Thr kinase [Kocuria]|uniref:non-specific serine/threonine protein kinase n=2 Tax=Kocuria TaxID=57493 RepID=A0A846TXN6_9MICC|nr:MULTISPECIES: Stk1 family PASTA domain-containing Ser/Thr kinase [Kocuria]NKE10512.1 Stk1 family PASTA domain-containing Ser/Thr kinase [Kocuria subflava]